MGSTIWNGTRFAAGCQQKSVRPSAETLRFEMPSLNRREVFGARNPVSRQVAGFFGAWDRNRTGTVLGTEGF
jgi:hypothetical protein